MIPYILAAVGGWLIGSAKDTRSKFADGGKILNQYDGKEFQDIWDAWDKHQRKHFLDDHEKELDIDVLYGDYNELINKKYDELPISVKTAVEWHVSDGQYAKGGKP